MDISIKCVLCGSLTQMKLATSIEAMLDIVRRDSVFCGFICDICGAKDDEELFGDKAEWGG